MAVGTLLSAMRETKHITIGTAGHIDHGKSSLVEALTGTHPDRLEEEKRRGITIDLGFAFLDLPDARLGFVDVPGHERFVRNMLAGAGGIDLALLVVAADESIKPQTREHFDICQLLGISGGLVAITKADLVDPSTIGLVRLEIEEFVQGSFLDGAPIVPVSAQSGVGLGELKLALGECARRAPSRDAKQYVRLPIDRAFTIKGFGAVATGTLVSGSLRAEDEVELFPSRRRLRVRGLQSGWQAATRAIAGQRTAVNLSGIEHKEIARGMTLATPEVFETTQRADVRLALLRSARGLKNRARVHFHQGTAETIAEVILLRAKGSAARGLAAGESDYAQLRFREPMLLLPGDRFIIRQLSPVITIGGGVVLDSLALLHRADDATVEPWLATIECGASNNILAALIDVSRGGMSLAEIRTRTAWSEEKIRDATKWLVASNQIRIVGENPLVLASVTALEEVEASVRKIIEDFQGANPLLPGASKQYLRSRVSAARGEVFDVALEDLAKSGVVVISGDMVRLPGREIGLSPEEMATKQLIEREFESADLSVPSFAVVLGKLPVEAARARKILQILLREKTLVKVTEELVFHRGAIEGLRKRIAGYKLVRGERIAVAAFKELTGVSRKYAIPLLEYLDRERVTRRVGDERVIL